MFLERSKRFDLRARLGIGLFAAVLFVRAFGILGLFQNQPLLEGLSKDAQYAKKVNYFKKDLPTDNLAETETDERVPVFYRLQVQPQRFVLTQNFTSNLLRSPPVSPAAV